MTLSYWFRPTHSTKSALIDIATQIRKASDTISKKAFVTVNHCEIVRLWNPQL